MSSEVDRLRKEVERRRQAVTNKINRTKRSTGANVSGSEFDPRRRSGIENKYNASQLRSYLSGLNDFMRRGNQFVSGQGGSPIPRGQFNLYKQAEEMVRQVRQARDKKMGDIITPSGMSIRAQQSAIPQSGGSSVYGPYKEFDRRSVDIKNAGAVEKLRQDLLNVLKPGYLDKKLDQGRDNAIRAAELVGADEYAERIENMSDEAFDRFWFGSNAPNALFQYYHLAKERMEGTHKERNQDKVVETAFDEISEHIDWAIDPDEYNRKNK